jgi:hypothetical protein
VPPTHATPGPARRAARVAASAVAAAAALTAAAWPAALGQQAHAQQGGPGGRVSIYIESVSPQWATPGSTVTVTGVVRNGTSQPQQGLFIQLLSSATQFADRDDLAMYAAGDLPVDVPEGTPVPLPAVIRPGGSVGWKLTLQPAAAGIAAFGVYPLAAQVISGAGLPLATERTFLPYWPGGAAAQRPKPLSIAWIWPLIAQPEQATCTALLNNDLAGSLASGGRLSGLLDAGRTYSAATHLTWAIDPALVQNAATMRSAYRVGGTAACTSAQAMPADRAAGRWLTGLIRALAGQQAFFTPYADVDVAALSHEGLDTDLAMAFADRGQARRILRMPASADTIAWPPDGVADAGVLGSLAINGIDTVVLDSSVMPPSGTLPDYTPSAQTTAASGVGSSLHVLLSDHTITGILGSPAATGNDAPGAAFSTAQRFLAETAMIVAEAPSLARSLVVAPPRRWNPVPGLADDLLSETARAPWLKPYSLASLAGVAHPSGQVPRQAPPAHQVSPDELSASYLGRVEGVDSAASLLASLLSPPVTGYLSTAIATLESSAWRGPAEAGTRQSLVARVLRYLAAQDKKVTIIDSGQITLGGSLGRVPVSISNGLSRTVRVRLHASVPPQGRLIVRPFDNLVTIAPGKTMTIRLPLQAPTVGVTAVTLSLLSPNDIPLPGSTVRLTVHATRFGRLALVIMLVALGVFVLTSTARAIRRARRDGPEPGKDTPDPPGPEPVTGSVVSADDLARADQPPEDPDEYADARGRATR